MIPEVHGRVVVSSPVAGAAAFGISLAAAAHLMKILRSTMYSDKVRAVLREYAANAKDAHAMAGKAGVPIEVTLPTFAAPTLVIRDHGPGLTPAEIFEIYTQYGESTKRKTNDAVGYLGIGSKSGFAYTDTFTIVSRTADGRRRTYVAVLDASEKGEIRLLDDSAEETGDTGMTIQIGVKTRDLDEFTLKAQEVYAYFNPQPIINTELPPLVTESTVVRGSEEWLAVMGGIAYPIDLDQLEVTKHLSQCGGVVFFPIGDLRVSASRESLEYDDFTKENLTKGLVDTFDSYVQSFTREVADLDQWQKRLRLQGMGLFGKMLGGLVFPGVFEDRVSCQTVAATVATELHLRLGFGSIRISAETRIVFIDDARAVKGYALSTNDYVVRRAASSTYAEAWIGLQDFVRLLAIQGVPVVRASSLPWTRPVSTRRYAKIKAAAFLLQPEQIGQTGRGRRRKPLSNNWEPVERAPDDDDVYMVLDAFNAPYTEYKADQRLLEKFDLEMPPVYGYRRVVDGDNVHPGTSYGEWRKGLYDMIVAADPTVEDVIAAMPFRSTIRWWRSPDIIRLRIAAAIEQLGAEHPVSKVLEKALAAKVVLDGVGEEKIDAVETLMNRMERDANATPTGIAALQKEYPLMDRFEALFGDTAAMYVEYIQALDLKRST